MPFEDFPTDIAEILKSLGYDFNISNWRQLLTLIENGAAHFTFYNDHHEALLAQVSKLTEIANTGRTAYQPAIAAMLRITSSLAPKFDAHKDALEEMMTRASWQYTKMGLGILEVGDHGEHAPRLIDVESAFLPGQRIRFLHDPKRRTPPVSFDWISNKMSCCFGQDFLRGNH
ncbi:MAG: hypothetical protein Q9181_006802 [Wetmoreana brouardii]